MESRRDYKKLMNIKKRNKNYAKATILGALGLGFFGITTQVNAEEWKANTVEQIKESVKESKDGIYIIKSGDTLSGISEATGITIETLAKVNNITNVDLIYAGDKLIIKTEDGKVALVDSDNNVKNEVNLSKEDKAGIKEVQAQPNNTVYTNTGSSSNTSNTNKGNNNGVIDTVKPVKPTGNGNGNNGGTTNPTNPVKPIDPVNPVDPVKPIEKEFTITVNHISEDGEVLSKETRKAKQNTTVEAKALDFTDRGYELVGESVQIVNVKEDTTITFTYKKIDTTKPEAEKVDVAVKHLGDDGKVLSTEVVKAEKDSTVKADAKDFTDMGYVLDDELTKSVKAVEGASIVFNYRKVDTPEPVEKSVVTTQYVAEDGTKLADNKVQEVEKGTLVKEEAIAINGYKVIGDSTQSVVANSNKTITFTYAKDEKPYEPVHTESDETRVIDENGTNLGQVVPDGYDIVSITKDDEVVTQANGDTHTIHVTFINVKKEAYVPVHTSETIVVNVDVNGTSLTDTSNYDYVSESTDSGVTTTAENGDTHTVFTKTVVWKVKEVAPTNPYMGTPMTNAGLNMEFNGGKGVGNSGMVWEDQMTAVRWVAEESGYESVKYLTWQVQLKTGEIMWTVDIYYN